MKQTFMTLKFHLAASLRTGCAWNILDIVLVLAQVTEELLLALAANSDGQHNADVIWTWDLGGWMMDHWDLGSYMMCGKTPSLKALS